MGAVSGGRWGMGRGLSVHLRESIQARTGQQYMIVLLNCFASAKKKRIRHAASSQLRRDDGFCIETLMGVTWSCGRARVPLCDIDSPTDLEFVC